MREQIDFQLAVEYASSEIDDPYSANFFLERCTYCDMASIGENSPGVADDGFPGFVEWVKNKKKG